MSSTEPIYVLFFSTGVAIGFGHCIGMCGPIVVALTLSLEERSNLVPLLLYTTGRIITYGILGGVLGAVGSFTVVAAHIEGVQKAVMVGTGILIVVMGLVLTGWIPFLRRFRVCCETPVVPSSVYKRIFRSRSDLVFLPLGLLLGLLPCGPVYTSLVMVARASMDVNAGAGAGFIYGMILMLLFGLGTAPALLIVGGLANTSWVRRRVLIERLAAFLMIAIGLYFTYKGFRF